MTGFRYPKGDKEQKNTPQRTSQNNGEALLNRAINYHARGDLANAEKHYREAIDSGLSNSAPYLNLALICKKGKRTREAIALYKKAIQINPHYPDAYTNLGSLYKGLGNLDQALASTLKSLELEPNNLDALINLGGIYKDLGNLEQALASTLKSLEHKPDNPTAHMNLGSIYKELGNLDKALAFTLKSLELKPDNLNALINLSGLYEMEGDHKNQQAALEKAKMIDPSSLNLQVMASQIFKKIHMNDSEIDEERKNFSEATRYIYRNPYLKLQEDLPVNFGTFWLAYHGRDDDKELIQQFCTALGNNNDIKRATSKYRLVHKSKKDDSPVKIGVISNFWCEKHPVNLHYSEIVNHLISTDIEIELIVGKGVSQSEQREIEKRYGTRVTRLTRNLERNCKTITDLDLDLLLYLDIGMSSETFLLGIARLAPVQTVMGGHPCTTGLTEIDYMITSSAVEIEDAELDYTEKLVRLSKMPSTISFRQQKSLQKMDRNLSKSYISIGIAHTLFKMHHEFDWILEEISRKCEDIEYILFDYPIGLKKYIKDRWRNNAPLTLSKSKFFSRVKYDNFLAILYDLDIMLDPIYFGSGTVFYQCMNCGLPVVSMPTRHRRTRATVSGYKQMGITNPPIAKSKEEYVLMCIDLIKSTNKRSSLKKEIQEKAHRLQTTNVIKSDKLRF